MGKQHGILKDKCQVAVFGGGKLVMFLPFNQMALSLSGRSKPPTQRKVVVLPQPEGPSKTMNSPSTISRFTYLQAWTQRGCLHDENKGQIFDLILPAP